MAQLLHLTSVHRVVSLQLAATTAAVSSWVKHQNPAAPGHLQTYLQLSLICTRLKDKLQTSPFSLPAGKVRRGGHEPALGALSGGASRASAAQQKVYIERAVLSSIDASLSFVPAPWTASRPAGQQTCIPLLLHGFPVPGQQHPAKCACHARSPSEQWR